MNERIQELAKQAGFHFDAYNEVTNRKAELFAELIVKECVEICKKQEYKYWRSSEEDHWTPIDSANAIQEHFGVE